MVMKNIDKIKGQLTGLIHFVMFYNDGTVFQTDFEQSQNIPQIGDHLAELLNHASKLIMSYSKNEIGYKKLIYETEKQIIFILKLGEESNIALLFENVDRDKIKITPIQTYLEKLEILLDMNKAEIQEKK